MKKLNNKGVLVKILILSLLFIVTSCATLGRQINQIDERFTVETLQNKLQGKSASVIYRAFKTPATAGHFGINGGGYVGSYVMIYPAGNQKETISQWKYGMAKKNPQVQCFYFYFNKSEANLPLGRVEKMECSSSAASPAPEDVDHDLIWLKSQVKI